MTSKQLILQRIRAAKPGPRPLPELPTYPTSAVADRETFISVLAGSKTTVLTAAEVDAYRASLPGELTTVVSTVPEYPSTLDVAKIKDPLELAGVDLAIISASVGVAENGAMWVDESDLIVRALPFITQHLLIVLRGEIVPTMHEGYRKVSVDRTGFGVWIAGPSKTADIEQSLVIGAHGARSLGVVISF